MVRGEANSYPVQLLVNYWEISPSEIVARLEALARQGVSQIATFVPWQAVESDISHSLPRMLLAASERGISVSLILTPEVGVHFPYSGLPKDIVARQEIQARHCGSGPAVIQMPPHRFALPSVSAPEFSKRYSSFLARMDGVLADFARSYGKSLDTVQLVLTGGFWKYYRSPRHCVQGPFEGMAGDFSGPAMQEYRNRVEHFYSQPEFSDPNPAAANRWKTQAMQEVNERWFSQQSEAHFRHRSYQQVRRKASAPVREIELFTPEADPSLSYLQFLEVVGGARGDFAALSSLVDSYASFASQGAFSGADSFIHWSSLASFRALSDPEKQFLILKSLLVMGGLGGGLFIDEEEWFALSATFRGRVDAFARNISQGDLQVKSRAFYLTPHMWSNAGPLWAPLKEMLGFEARMISSLDAASGSADANLLVVDPSCIISSEILQRLLAWSKAGRIVVLPRTHLYTQTARNELELGLARSKRMDIDLGVRYRIHHLGEGKLIVHDLPQGVSNPLEASRAWRTFLTSLLSVAGIETYCKVSDARLATIPLWKSDGRTLGLFVINSTKRQIGADLIFSSPVEVSDLAVAVSATKSAAMAPLDSFDEIHSWNHVMEPATRFTLEIPPNGVLPLQVGGLIQDDSRERLEAAQTSDALREGVQMAALSELAGIDEAMGNSIFDSGGEGTVASEGGLWN